jgi:hypothetical protein
MATEKRQVSGSYVALGFIALPTADVKTQFVQTAFSLLFGGVDALVRYVFKIRKVPDERASPLIVELRMEPTP